ncbi:hypothetical protein TL16_g00781 [Triparma laevis f. inornata]|uniref:N-acetyltransferase domain-containing protein n=1 Tax=Triparma laevis f. inornata TaxID=1714386 RepID=A0A9W6ZDX1_9STRA|nr:hypothetical protein TL16_g00781 [Triparma laevis f. inornata]
MPDWAKKQNSEAQKYNQQAQQAAAKKAGGGRMGYGLGSGGAGVTTTAQSSSSAIGFDFRFADDDEEDAQDITACVNSAFGSNAPSLSADDLSGGRGARWLVVETPSPDEVMVACCRLKIDMSEKPCAIDILAVDSRAQGKGAGTYLLKKAENMAFGMGCKKCEICVGHWMERVVGWCKKRGYESGGGELWPEARIDEIPEPTQVSIKAASMLPMMVRMRKKLGGEKKDKKKKKKEAQAMPDFGAALSGGQLDFISDITKTLNALPVTHDVSGTQPVATTITASDRTAGMVQASAGGAELEDLVGDLLKALKTDQGRKDFKRLSKAVGDDET